MSINTYYFYPSATGTYGAVNEVVKQLADLLISLNSNFSIAYDSNPGPTAMRSIYMAFSGSGNSRYFNIKATSTYVVLVALMNLSASGIISAYPQFGISLGEAKVKLVIGANIFLVYSGPATAGFAKFDDGIWRGFSTNGAARYVYPQYSDTACTLLTTGGLYETPDGKAQLFNLQISSNNSMDAAALSIYCCSYPSFANIYQLYTDGTNYYSCTSTSLVFSDE